MVKWNDAVPLGVCPCGKNIYAIESAKDCFVGVIHELPYCEAFKKNEPLQFLKYVRLSRGVGDN